MLYKKPRDFNPAECMIWMYKYNPGKVDIYMHGDYPRHLIFLAPIDQLKFPDGWYFVRDTKTINKTGSIVCVNVVFKEW